MNSIIREYASTCTICIVSSGSMLVLVPYAWVFFGWLRGGGGHFSHPENGFARRALANFHLNFF